MPARTNDFQEIVALIERALAPKGAKVTQSSMVPVHGLPTLREVDVLIEGEFGPYNMKVAVEAKDHRRKISIQTFDSLLAKYRGEGRVHVDKFVIVSSRGFTKGVIEKAAATDVELLTIKEAKRKDWSNVTVSAKGVYRPPRIERITIRPKLPVVDEEFACRNGRIINSRGIDQGTPYAVAHWLFFQKYLPINQAKFQAFESKVSRELGGNAIGIINFHGAGLTNHGGLKLRLGTTEYPVEDIEVHVRVINLEASAVHKAYERGSTTGETRTVHHAKLSIGNTRAEILFSLDGLEAPQSPKSASAENEELLDATSSDVAWWLPNAGY